MGVDILAIADAELKATRAKIAALECEASEIETFLRVAARLGFVEPIEIPAFLPGAGEVAPPPSTSPATIPEAPTPLPEGGGQRAPTVETWPAEAKTSEQDALSSASGETQDRCESVSPSNSRVIHVTIAPKTSAEKPGSEAAVDDADAAPAGEAPAPDASPAPRKRKVDGEEVERTQKRKQVAQLNARHPELTPEEAAARLLMPLITLRTFTAELGIEWSAARRADPPAPTERRPTKTERIRLMHEAHPTWTARMIANELGEKETTVSTLLAGIRRAERERAGEEVVEKEAVR